MIKLNTSISNFLLFSSIFSIVIINHGYAGNKVAAKVNGIAIHEDALMAEVNKKLPLNSYHSRVSNDKLQKLRNQVLQELIEEELFHQEAKKQELDIDLFELEQRISLMKSGYQSEEAFQQALSNSGLNSLSLMDVLKRRLLIEKIQKQEINDKVTVTEADLRTYYETNQSKFVIPEQVHLRHIQISVKPGAMAAGWQQGLETANQIYSRLIEGEDFAQVAKEVSADSSSREKGGDIGWFHKGQLIPELEEAFSEIKVGEISKPVRSIYGYHITKVEEKRPEKQLTFDEINSEDLKKKLVNNRIGARRQEVLNQLKAQSNIRIFEL